MIRIIIAGGCVVLFLILTAPILVLEWLIGKWNPKFRDISSLRIVQAGFKAVAWLSGVKLTVKGEENVPLDTPVLYVANHRSFFDIVLTYARCPRLTGYVAKKEVKKVPLLSHWMERLYCLFLDRKDIREGLKTILTAIEYVNNGISITIFPEGTRGKGKDELDMLPFHEGSFKIAMKTGCPIIPVAIVNSSAVFEDHFPRVTSEPVIIEYGAPIYPKELSREDQKLIGRKVQDIIAEMIKENMELIPKKGQ